MTARRRWLRTPRAGARRRRARAARDSKSGSKSALRVRSKGTGLICVRPGGIAPNTYLGVLRRALPEAGAGTRRKPPRRAASRRAHVARRGSRVLQRRRRARRRRPARVRLSVHRRRREGDSILTRASHSGAPNAAMRVRVRDGAYAVEMASVERVRVGDEICWDYRCRTDSEREMRAALCLCGSRQCRVSYLHFAGHDDTSCVLKKEAPSRTSPPRCSGRAGRAATAARGRKGTLSQTSRTRSPPAPPPPPPPPTPRSRAAPRRRGSRRARGTPRACFSGCPRRLTRYVAFCVAFAAEEREALAEVLEARFAAETNASDEKVTRATTESGANESKSASRLDAEAEAEGVHAGRLQSLAVTLDKVRHVLVHACGGGQDRHRAAASGGAGRRRRHRAPRPRRRLARRRRSPRALGVDVPEDRVSRSASHKKNPSEYDELVEARRALASLATSLRTQVAQVDTHVVSGGLFGVAADLGDLAARTKTFFRAVPVRAFESPFVQVGKFDGGDAGRLDAARVVRAFKRVGVSRYLARRVRGARRSRRGLGTRTGAGRVSSDRRGLGTALARGCAAVMNENAKASDLQDLRSVRPEENPKIPRGPIGGSPTRFALDLRRPRGADPSRGPRVLGWEWASATTSRTRVCARARLARVKTRRREETAAAKQSVKRADRTACLGRRRSTTRSPRRRTPTESRRRR